MMSLRAGFDIDGVLADFRSAFEDQSRHRSAAPVDPGVADEDSFTNRELKRIWARILRTTNWWASLQPYEPDQIVRLYEIARRRKWEVVFMTKRPVTRGEPVQFQTQHWLEQHGFHYPAVVTVPGSRGELANALRLDIIVDDQLYNCVDVVTGSHAKALLLDRTEDAETAGLAIARGIGVVRSLGEAIDAMVGLDQAQEERKGRLQRLGDWFGATASRDLPAKPDAGRVSINDPDPGDDEGV